MKPVALAQQLLLFSLILTLCALRDTAAQTSPPAGAKADQEKRVALVMGNDRYAKNTNPQLLNDARAMAEALRELGFEVLTGENPSQSELRQLLRTFGERAHGGSASLFYFAGVGVQSNGSNYLIPSDAKIKRQADIRREAIALDDVLAQMKEAGARVNLVLLDACRVYPAPATRRVLLPGLAPLKAPAGTLISYATQPGKIEYAQPSRHNSPYTASLLQQLHTPDLSLADFFQHVRAEVEELTKWKQTPWETSAISSDFHFVPIRKAVVNNTVATVDDLSTWSTIANSTNRQDFEAFLAKFPNSVYAEAAQMKLRRLTAKTGPAVEPQQSLPEELFPLPPTTTTEEQPAQKETKEDETPPPASLGVHLTTEGLANMERAFYAACYQQKNEALCCQLSRELVRQAPESSYARAAATKARDCGLTILWESFQKALMEYYSGPSAAKLERLFATGDAFLAETPNYPYVVAQQALAGSSAALTELYKDKDKAKSYVEKGLKLFDPSMPMPSDEEQKTQITQFREDIIALGNQYLGYYTIQTKGDPQQAIAYLEKSIAVKTKPNIGWKDPNNYWLRSTIRNDEYGKLSNKYKALTDDQKNADAGKELLQKINAVMDLLIADYARTVAVANRPQTKVLQDAARESLTSLWKYRHNGSLTGMEETIKRYADDPSAP